MSKHWLLEELLYAFNNPEILSTLQSVGVLLSTLFFWMWRNIASGSHPSLLLIYIRVYVWQMEDCLVLGYLSVFFWVSVSLLVCFKCEVPERKPVALIDEEGFWGSIYRKMQGPMSWTLSVHCASGRRKANAKLHFYLTHPALTNHVCIF